MVCLGLKPGAAWWKAQTNPLSYSGTPSKVFWQKQFVDVVMEETKLQEKRIRHTKKSLKFCQNDCHYVARKLLLF